MEWRRFLDTDACSDSEIRAVGSDGTRYAAPTLIGHYVKSHRYVPPRGFVDAVMRCASLTWKAARDARLCLSCGTRLKRKKWFEETCRGCGARYVRYDIALET
jgi:hypothetical protein